MSTLLAKSAFDCKHVKSVSAAALLHNGQFAGKIIADWSDNPAGSTCRATVIVFSGPLRWLPKSTGSAGGYGYDKLSAAIDDAMHRGFANMDKDERPKAFTLPDLHGRGMGAVSEWFKTHGYEVHELI